MQEGITKKIENFRKSIRREQIEAYKKMRRKELIDSEEMNANDYSSELQEAYWGVLRHHELANLRQMPYEVFQAHMQMLNQLVFSEQCGIFVDAFEKIMAILVDFYEEAIRSWMEQAKNYLSNHNVDEIEVEQIATVYGLTKVLSFIPVNNFLKLIGGIYHDINPQRNMILLQKVVVILKDILHFSFLDFESIKKCLQYFESNLDLRLNKTVNKDFIFTIFMNISYSEEDNIIEMLKQENVFGRIMESAELYGLKIKEWETLAGFYSNSIDYLCRTIHNSPVEQQHQSQIQQEQLNINNLYLPLFQQLANLESLVVIEHLVHIANCLLKTSSNCHLNCKAYIMSQVQTLIRNIITTNQYFPECEQLFIDCVNQFDFTTSPHPMWITDFLSIIFKNHLLVYYGNELMPEKTKEKYENKSKGKILRDINELLKACQLLLCRCDQDFIEFQELLVKDILQFWCREDIIMGYEQLIIFLQIAIDRSEDLSNFIIFQNYAQEFVMFLDSNYEKREQVDAVLSLINSTCNRLDSIEISQLREYLRKFEQNWRNILMRLEGYCRNNFISQIQYSELAINLNSRVQILLKDAFNQ